MQASDFFASVTTDEDEIAVSACPFTLGDFNASDFGDHRGRTRVERRH
jgi:hypothetical protein